MRSPRRSHNTPTPLKEFLFGSPYYPEHWDKAIRDKDPELFQKAGWNVIRMAEFAWDLMEPEEGYFDFSLFDETIASFAEKGIRTILCTPTATPPHWLVLKHPEVLREDDQGRIQLHGSRQHASHFSPVFREYSRLITAAMASHFAGNPHVIGWQTDNEFHCHFSEDHCAAAKEAFACSLQKRHGDIHTLNKAWGTAFWAQTYQSFEEIPTPRHGRPTYVNPAHVLDYKRFISNGVTVFQHEQVQILRAANPDWWITHNGFYNHIDYAGEFSDCLDFLAYDSYPFYCVDPAIRPPWQAFQIDHSRSFSGNLVIMEQQSGAGGQGDYLHDTPEPGEMRRMAWVNIARGADGLLFFRERSCRFGAEEHWCGVIDHDNVPRRRYHEAAQLGRELARVGPLLLGTHVECRIAVATGDFDSQWGHSPITHGLPDPRTVAETVHRYFYNHGYSVGCAHPAGSLDGLEVYIVPHLSVFNPQWVGHWLQWVEAGGTLVIGARTSCKDLNGNVIAETLPGALRPLVGATVEEYGRQNRPDRRPLNIRFTSDPNLVTSDLWYEYLLPADGTTVEAIWSGRHLDGKAALTCCRHGKGSVLYLGTYFTPQIISAIEGLLIRKGILSRHPEWVPGVEQLIRCNAGTRYRFVINHNECDMDIPLCTSGHELLSDKPVSEFLRLDAGEVAIIREELTSKSN